MTWIQFLLLNQPSDPYGFATNTSSFMAQGQMKDFRKSEGQYPYFST